MFGPKLTAVRRPYNRVHSVSQQLSSAVLAVQGKGRAGSCPPFFAGLGSRAASFARVTRGAEAEGAAAAVAWASSASFLRRLLLCHDSLARQLLHPVTGI